MAKERGDLGKVSKKNLPARSRPSSTTGNGGLTSKTSSVSTRSPGDLPMPISFHQSRDSMMQRRSTRNYDQIKVNVVEKVSVQQCKENKQLFEKAVDKAESTLGLNQSGTLSPTFTSNFSLNQPSNQSRSPSYQKSSVPSSFSANISNHSTLPSLNDSSLYSHGDKCLPGYAKPSSCSLQSKTNGPTLIGSPLYNKSREFSLDDTGINGKHSPPPVVYNHDRYSSAPPALRRHIQNINSSYKVVTPWHDPSEPPTHHILKNPAQRDHIFLIPHDEDYPFGFQHDYPNGILTSTLLEEPPNQRIQNWTNSGEIHVLDNPEVHDNGCLEENLISQGVEEAGSNVQRCEKNGVHFELTEPTLLDDKKAAIQIEKGDPSKTDAKSRPTEAKDPGVTEKATGGGSDESSSLPSRPSSAHYWLKKSWVDDATVTSSKKSEEAPVVDEPVPEKPTGKAAPNSPRKNEKSKGDPKSPTKIRFDMTKGGNNKTEVLNKEPKPTPNENAGTPIKSDPPQVLQDRIEVLNLNDLKRRRTALPKFICPSSETKSKEAAVRDWLETTSIHWAVKTSPLL